MAQFPRFEDDKIVTLESSLIRKVLGRLSKEDLNQIHADFEEEKAGGQGRRVAKARSRSKGKGKAKATDSGDEDEEDGGDGAQAGPLKSKKDIVNYLLQGPMVRETGDRGGGGGGGEEEDGEKGEEGGGHGQLCNGHFLTLSLS